MSIFRARWILPIETPPIDGGWIEVAGDRIAAVGHGRAPSGATDLGDVAVLPGLVNAHTHVELSWMSGRVPAASSMDEWIRTLLAVRREGPPSRAREISAARDAAASMRATGTVLVGDVSNSLLTPHLLADAGLDGVVFHELLGFNHPDPHRAVREAWARLDAECPLRTSVVAHSPYSVSPDLFRAIGAAKRDTPLSVHLAESKEELEFLRTGRGPIRNTLETLGVWTDAWAPPQSDPVEYMATVGYLQPGTLIAHGVHLTDDGLERLRKARAVIVTCPRSNLWVGAGSPRLPHFYAAKLPVAIGTDSLASTSTLNMFDELAEMRRLAPEISAGKLLESATRVGADALGFGEDFGTIAPGKRASFAAVRVPAAVTDVEEYLVSGVSPADVQPLIHA